MTPHNLLPPPRLVASGGPVTRAVEAGRGEGVEAERERLRGLRRAIQDRIVADAALIARLDAAVVAFSTEGGAA